MRDTNTLYNIKGGMYIQKNKHYLEGKNHNQLLRYKSIIILHILLLYQSDCEIEHKTINTLLFSYEFEYSSYYIVYY